jgi:hypothetical protein
MHERLLEPRLVGRERERARESDEQSVTVRRGGAPIRRALSLYGRLSGSLQSHADRAGQVSKSKTFWISAVAITCW